MSVALSLGGIPTLAALTGSSAGSASLLQTINNELNSGFFGGMNDILSRGREFFIQNVTQPVRETFNTLKNAIGVMARDESYIPLRTEEDLQYIPTVMYDPILRYKPIKKLFDEGRIFGFGWDYVPDDDIYGRLINNGTVNNVQEAMDDEGYFELKYHFESTDPDLSFEELESIEESRRYLDKILAETTLDPTDYPNDRG